MKITLAHAPLHPADIARMCGGTLLSRADIPAPIKHICTDSREVDGETLFVAIRGERVDGHRFLPAVAAAGCPAFLCDHVPDGWTSDPALAGAAAILVPDTVAALAALSAAYRTDALPHLTVVAITGSVGKTTTKETVAATLAAARRVFKKDGNYNSTIGLPLSCLEIGRETETAVLEMGMSSRGEIAAMTAAARPDVAIIANIGTSHLEHLGTRENIARAKLEIAQGLRPGGALIINGDEPLLAHLGQDFSHDRPTIPEGIRVLRVSLSGTPGADYTVRRMAPYAGGMQFDLDTPCATYRDLWIPAPGEHLVWAGAFAVAAAELAGLDESAIRRGLTAYRPADLRQSVRTIHGVTFLEDCYNAAPESMRAALGVLDILAAPSAARRIAVLGDMRELGENTVALHREIGAEVARRGVARLVTVGPLGAEIARGALEAGMDPAAVTSVTDDGNDTCAALAASLAAEVKPGDHILFKASRAMALETVSAAVSEAVAARLAHTDQSES